MLSPFSAYGEGGCASRGLFSGGGFLLGCGATQGGCTATSGRGGRNCRSCTVGCQAVFGCWFLDNAIALPHILLYVDELSLNAVTLFGEKAIVALILVDEYTVLEVLRFVDVALVECLGEVVVGTHCSSIVIVGGVEDKLSQIGRNVLIFEPEEGRLSERAEVATSGAHRAEGCDLRAESACVLVVVGALLEKVDGNLVGRQVGIIDTHTAVLDLVEELVTIHQLLCRYLVLGAEIFVAVEGVVVCLDLSTENEFEEIDKEVFSSILRGLWIVKHGILVLGEVERAIDVATPVGILWHGLCHGELTVDTATFGGRLCVGAPFGWLRQKGEGAEEEKAEEQ